MSLPTDLVRVPAFLGLLLFAFNTGGCSREPNPVGVWVLDVEALAQHPEIHTLAGEQRAQALKLAKKMLGEVRITLGDGGHYEQRFAGRSLTGRFTFGERAGPLFKLRVTPTGQPERTLIFELVDERRARMTTPDGATLVLVRQ
jgi:hypothetical protein